MNAKNNVLNATDVEQYFIDHIEVETEADREKLRAEYNEFCTDLENILAKKMQPEQVNRVKIFLKFFLGTKEQIEAAMVNIEFGNCILNLSVGDCEFVLMIYILCHFFRFRLTCMVQPNLGDYL